MSYMYLFYTYLFYALVYTVNITQYLYSIATLKGQHVENTRELKIECSVSFITVLG